MSISVFVDMQKLKGLESVGQASQPNNPALFSSERVGGTTMENYSTDVRNYQNADQVTWEPSDVDYIDSGDIEKQEPVTNSISNKNEPNINLPAEEGQTALHVANNRDPCCSTSFASKSGSHPDGNVKKTLRRVTIHGNFQKIISERPIPKLVILPDSIEELLILAGQKFGGHNFAKVVNSENAEVDDLSVIRDGDHLFFLPNDCECRDNNVT